MQRIIKTKLLGRICNPMYESHVWQVIIKLNKNELTKKNTIHSINHLY